MRSQTLFGSLLASVVAIVSAMAVGEACLSATVWALGEGEAGNRGGVRVVLRDTAGDPWSDGHAVIKGPGNEYIRLAVVSGVIQSSQLRPGTYTLLLFRKNRKNDERELSDLVRGLPIVETEISIRSAVEVSKTIVIPEAAGDLVCKVVDFRGNAVKGAIVWIARRDDTSWGAYDSERTEEGGVVVFKQLSRGPYLVRVPRVGLDDEAARFAAIRAVDLKREPVQVEICSPQLSPLRGCIRGEGGEPISNATVQVLAGEMRTPDQTKTSQDGKFTLDAMPLGQLIVIIDADGYTPLHERILHDGRTQEVSLAPARKVVVHGRVLDKHENISATVTCSVEGEHGAAVQTGIVRHGEFEVAFVGLNIGELKSVGVRIGDFVAVKRAIAPDESGDSLVFNVPLNVGTTLRGRIHDASQLLRHGGIRIAIAEAGLFGLYDVCVSENGEFEISGVPDGDVTLSFHFFASLGESKTRQRTIRVNAKQAFSGNIGSISLLNGE